ncbi:hypothetical protein CXB74_006885 [Morganella morganii]|uniref:neuraminidase-like domain-containing protein n=2 Tax=Morganella morganii TaxID=582 RepID=UPI001C767162|nr:neuraminidase-like domain-containing protein [Morganella morganii]QXO43942.1 hypothetical protein CXB74_006885 [Morganella morganii]
MEKITRVLEKLNQGRTDQLFTLSDLMPLSLAEIRNLGHFSRDDAHLLYRAAQKEKQNNILYTARALTRANPLLRKEMGRARYHGATPYGYDDIIVPRADEFAAPGAVSSMFSPAGYLTELYREARGLHQKDTPRNLDKRRPDLATLALSQSNLDDEISTLALSNEQLETALMAQANITSKYWYYEPLATSRNSGVTPYHAPFGEIREALAQQDFVLPDHVLSKGTESAAQMALYAGISPELYAILTEKTEGLSEAETDALLKKNFPAVNTDSLMDLNALANYYGLPRDEIQEMLEAVIAEKMSAQKYMPHKQSQTGQSTINTYIQPNGKIKDEKLTITLITDNEDFSKEHIQYFNILPQGNNHFLVSFMINDKRVLNDKGSMTILVAPDWDVEYEDMLWINKNNHYYQAHIHYEQSFTYNPELSDNHFYIIAFASSIPIERTYQYESSDTSPAFILTVNKLLRLAKATGITPLETQRALTRLGSSLDATVLHRFCEALLYCKRYTISMDKALVLSGADISTVSYDGQLSQFDRLFNNPPLDNQVYPLDGTTLDLTADNTDYRIPYLLRAFQITRSDLLSLNGPLHKNVTSETKIINNLEQISKLYLLTLLCGIHSITPAQIDHILYNSPYYGIGTIGISDIDRREIINYLWQTTQWLNAQNISADTLYLLQVYQAEQDLTKEMITFLEALRNGGIDSTSENALYSTMAPVVAAAMQLESPEMGEVVLRWLDTYTHNGALKTEKIWPLIATETPSDFQKKVLFTWCYALAQRVLLIRTLTLSYTEVQVLSADTKPRTVDSLRQISNFHALINRCGEHAGDVLSKLHEKTIRPSELENYSGIPYALIVNALKMNADIYITTWQQLAVLPDYINIADTLRILPQDFNNLLSITGKTAPTYYELYDLSRILQAGLSEQQTQQIQNPQESRRSEALSGEYRSLIMKKPLANRDDIWRELLVDGKVSADITTTRLADAIAGIQLYINRTIAGDETGAESAVLERQFFKDWDTYNKRYSTWAGVSQLVYYPENTIDPTIRIGQTGMMNTMLEQLSQSELNSDTLEDGFRQYLTAFEQVANLKVVSGYHDALDIDEGNTWFIGTSQTEPKKYYWRKADHRKCQYGRFAANAWSDWKEITCAINPYQEMVRPVIFRSRLYLLWVEEQIRKDAKGENDISAFSIKLTHIKYDGSWASPFSYDITSEFSKLPEGKQDRALYCAASEAFGILTIACYKKPEEQVDQLPDKTYFGFNIQVDMTRAPSLGLQDTLASAILQLDTIDQIRINIPQKSSYTMTLTPEEQEGSDQLTTSIVLEDYDIYRKGNNTFLSVKPAIENTINITSLPEVLRRLVANQYSNPIYELYQAKAVTPSSEQNLLPQGNYTCHILDNNDYPSTYLYLSIPFGKNPPDHADSLTLLADGGDNTIAIDIDIQGKDEKNHYYSSRDLKDRRLRNITKYVVYADSGSKKTRETTDQ